MKVLIVSEHGLARLALIEIVCDLDRHGVLVIENRLARVSATAMLHPDLDLVIVDLDEAGAGGVDGVERLIVFAPDRPVAVLSSSEADARVVEAVGGAVRFLTKRSPVEALRRALHDLLRGRVRSTAASTVSAVSAVGAGAGTSLPQVRVFSPGLRKTRPLAHRTIASPRSRGPGEITSKPYSFRTTRGSCASSRAWSRASTPRRRLSSSRRRPRRSLRCWSIGISTW